MTNATSAEPAAPEAKPLFTEGYKRLVLMLLVVAYTLNFIDRTIISTIGQAIKDDLKLTDTQLGLLGGLYFALLYTFLGIPIARLAERFSRINIITAAIIIWSGFTVLCGTAGNFATLALYRFGVGFGEAGLSPSAHSMISDYYPPNKRATALSFYSFGIPLGAMLGAVIGGQMLDHFSWRMAFVLVGLPGLGAALLIKLLVREPPRGHSEPARTGAAYVRPAYSLSGELKEIGAVIATLFGSWPLLNMVLAVTIASFASYGAGQFLAPYFIRTFHLTYGHVGLITGLVAGIGQGVGYLVSGALTDHLGRTNARWYALTPAIGLVIAYPLYLAIYNASTWQTAALLLLIPGLFSTLGLGPTSAVVQNMVPAYRRATATAILFFTLNLVGLGLGPPLTGWAIDHLATFHFTHPDQSGVMATIQGLFAAHPADFQAACPGGKAVSGAAEAAKAACSGALVLGTRQGILIAYAAMLWAALHYLLASFGLGAALARARAARGEAR